MNYAESISKLKEETEYERRDIGDIIDRACQFAFLEGQRQQHERTKNAINEVILEHCFDGTYGNSSVATSKIEDALASLSPGEEGKTV